MDKKAEIEELLTRGVVDVIVRKDLERKLQSGTPLKVKLGIDPTSPRLHLGHTVALRKLRQFQELGHQIIFLIGDFTARIGDPSDRLSARKPLTPKEIEHNMKLYRAQIGKVLDLENVTMRHNAEWHANMDFAELFQLASWFSVNQMLERDMFQKRMKSGKPLWIHELLYPLLQGYDSVALQADVELGGTDQTFNVLAARTIQPHYNQEPQDIITVQLIEGTDGKSKMSKSIGNTIDLDDEPREMYGKLMSIPDTLIIKYFTTLTDTPMAEISEYQNAMAAGENPRAYKAKLAWSLVKLYHSVRAADEAEKEFARVFQGKQAPQDIPEYAIKKAGSFSLVDTLVETGLAKSKSDARRLIEQGAVEFDSMLITDWKKKVRVASGMVLRAGKRKFVRLVINKE
ncbi:MAG: tyrosine--tRNA ligase [Patescibacteria group bacterium]|nr:tyrosine--tRNA ligase [Patescibacteria group bacterium]MDD5715973.1 tyrosine--tRNA ligase [Patescibacteria group bacterium]